MAFDDDATKNAVLAFKKSIKECCATRVEEGATADDINKVAFKCAGAVGDLLKRIAEDGLIINAEDPENAWKITKRVIPVCIAAEEMMNRLTELADNVLGVDN